MDAVWCQPFLLPSLSIWHFSTKRTDDRAKVGLFLYVSNNNNDLFSKCFFSVRREDRIAFIQLALFISSAVFFWLSASSYFHLIVSSFFFFFISSGPLNIILHWWCPPPLRSDMVLDHSGFASHCFLVFSWTAHFTDPACPCTWHVSYYLGRHASSPLEIRVCGSCPWHEQSYLQMPDRNISLPCWDLSETLPHHCLKQAKPHFAWGRAS